VSGKLLGLALLTVLPVRERGNNYRCSDGSECRGDRSRRGDGYLRDNQYGFTVGCPIQIPKAFNSKNRFCFMSNFETLRNRSSLLQSASVQTLAVRSNNESGHLWIIDDRNTRVCTTNASSDIKAISATSFPYNGVPASRLGPYALKLFQYHPLPKYRGVPGAPGVGGIPPLAPAGRGILGVSLTNELSGFGSNSNGPFLHRNVAFQWLDSLSVNRGTRSFKFVGEIRRHLYNQLGVCLIHKSGGINL
jgi:hypothetical protein